MQVADKTIVSLRYCMKNSKGDVLENRLQLSPVEYLHGGGGIMPALEQSLLGLQPGETKLVTINNSMDFQLDDTFYFDVVIDDVREATHEEILRGKPIKSIMQDDCGPDCIC